MQVPLSILAHLFLAGPSLLPPLQSTSAPASMPRPRKHAVVIGVDVYRTPQVQPLRGAANDARRLAEVLRDRFGFDQIRLLTAAQALLPDELPATQKQVRATMAELLQQARGGDVAVFAFCGHGTLVQDEPPETPGHDEPYPFLDSALVLGDSPSLVEGLIRDDEVREWITALALKGAAVTTLFDACHSGSAARGGSRRTRGTSAGLTPPASRPAGATETGPRFVRLPGDAGVSMSACLDEQEAEELDLPPEDGGPAGVFSLALRQALLRADPGTTYDALFDQVLAGMRATAPNQTPTLRGERTIDGKRRLLFGTGATSGMAVPIVLAADGGGARISAGLAHGVRAGATFEVWPQGIGYEDALLRRPEPVATLEVTQVFADHVRGIWRKPPPKGTALGLALCTAVREPIGRFAVRVAADVPEAMLEGWRAAARAHVPPLAGLEFLRAGSPEPPGRPAMLVASLVRGRRGAGLHLAGGMQLRAVVSEGPEEGVAMLEKVLHFQGLLSLSAPQPNLLGDRVEMLVRLDPQRRTRILTSEEFMALDPDLPRAADGRIQLQGGRDAARDSVVSVAISGRLRWARRHQLHVHLLDLTSDHGIKLLSEKPVDPNGLTVIDQVHITPPHGPECLLAIVAQRPIPGIRCLVQEQLFRGADQQDALAELLSRRAKPFLLRGDDLVDDVPADWTVLKLCWDVVLK